MRKIPREGDPPPAMEVSRVCRPDREAMLAALRIILSLRAIADDGDVSDGR